ncbi:uncharacterized protein LOC134761368 [Pongo abelii]|uniref:uncharacterized protein LOC134761368 n=1 Tax=Pongo abelii TaxID=9601 RepID=UPI0030050645
MHALKCTAHFYSPGRARNESREPSTSGRSPGQQHCVPRAKVQNGNPACEGRRDEPLPGSRAHQGRGTRRSQEQNPRLRNAASQPILPPSPNLGYSSEPLTPPGFAAAWEQLPDAPGEETEEAGQSALPEQTPQSACHSQKCRPEPSPRVPRGCPRIAFPEVFAAPLTSRHCGWGRNPSLWAEEGAAYARAGFGSSLKQILDSAFLYGLSRILENWIYDKGGIIQPWRKGGLFDEGSMTI